MDPDKALENMRAAIAELPTQLLRSNDPYAAMADVIDAWETLDSWLSKGGYRPEDWKP
jgi:hypothetical protein